MGCDMNGTCRDCKVTAHFGYGSYGTWGPIGAGAEKWALSEGPDELIKNRNMRDFLREHMGHDYLIWSSDWTYREGDDLVQERGYKPPEVVVRGERAFSWIDMDAAP